MFFPTRRVALWLHCRRQIALYQLNHETKARRELGGRFPRVVQPILDFTLKLPRKYFPCV